MRIRSNDKSVSLDEQPSYVEVKTIRGAVMRNGIDWVKRALATGVVGALSALLLVACSGGVEGSYFYGEGDEGITLELRGENVAVISISGLSEIEGTYSVAGDKVTLTMPGGDIDEFTIQDGNLTTRAFGEDMVFEKQ
jgi:hypothetical protein